MAGRASPADFGHALPTVPLGAQRKRWGPFEGVAAKYSFGRLR